METKYNRRIMRGGGGDSYATFSCVAHRDYDNPSRCSGIIGFRVVRKEEGGERKVKIDRNGDLWIERRGKLVRQSCMRATTMGTCGEHCPMFHYWERDGLWYVRLCTQREWDWVFEQFEIEDRSGLTDENEI